MFGQALMACVSSILGKKTKNLKLIFVEAVDGVCCHPGSLFGKKQKTS
jgi:hypothetical protein